MRKAVKSTFAVIALALGLLPLVAAPAAADHPPSTSILNPESGATGTPGPGPKVSDKLDVDERYHIVGRAIPHHAGATITEVRFFIDPGTGVFREIGVGTRVGTTDTWELFWDVDVANASGFVRMVATDSLGGTDDHIQAVTFLGAEAETVEITNPANGGALPFFTVGTESPVATITARVSAGATGASLSYMVDPASADPNYVACGTATVTAVNTDGTKDVAGACNVGTVDPATITGVAARAIAPAGTETSGDAHRVTANAQTVTTFAIVPAADEQTVGFCNTYTVQARDAGGNAVVGVPVDVRAVGTTAGNVQDDLQFAGNAAVEGEASDPFTAANTGFTSEPAAGCDLVGEPDASPDDNDSNAATGLSQGTVAAADAPDPIAIEGATAANGNFRFSLDAEQAGGVNVLAFVDLDDNDVRDTNEPQATATKTFNAPTATTTTTTPTTTTPPRPAGDGPGYWMVASDGGIFAFDAPFSGSTGSIKLNQPIVGMADDPDGRGYFLVAADGGIFAFEADFKGSTGGMRLNKPIVGMAADPDGSGYWLVASDGGIFAFDADFHGSTGSLKLNQPIVGMAADPDGRGYFLVAADGGIFAFDANFKGSTGGTRLNRPIVGMAADPDGSGYFLVASDGGIFAFDATFHGSTGAIRLNQPIVGMAADPDGRGYWLVASDGGIFAFEANFKGSTGAIRLNRPVVGMAPSQLSA